MKRWLGAATLLFCAVPAFGDKVPYRLKHEIVANSRTVKVQHVHNWSSPKIQTMFLDLSHHGAFLSSANDFASVEVLESSGRLIFRSPSPALTHIWISPDSQFIVGISYIKLYNPYQLVVWQRDGTVVHAEHIAEHVAKLTPEERREFSERFPRAEQFLRSHYFIHDGTTFLDCSILGVPNEIDRAAWEYLYLHRTEHPYSDDFRESVTNYVEWFDRENPDVALQEKEGSLVLSLRSPTGRRFRIQIGSRDSEAAVETSPECLTHRCGARA
jgi:hypothetical protein